MTLVFNRINCLSYIYNNNIIIIKGSHQVITDCSSFIMSPPCLSHLVDPSENILPKMLNMMKCFIFNKTYNSIFFLSTSLKSTPVSPPNHSKKYHQCDHIRKQLGLGNLMPIFIAPD